ncbi:MAG TPA: DUF3099 domain-containing protein [Streptosporangiaceae bacterium]|nr:DUF3099 domain-containing protein [Streptosporangiaceae bacterium]
MDYQQAAPAPAGTAPARRGDVTMTRNRAYFALMGGCLVAVILAWTVVRLYSVTAAIVISVAVGLVPPVAAIVANAGDESSRRQ